MAQYLSTDPNAGEPIAPDGYLSTDPSAGLDLNEQPTFRTEVVGNLSDLDRGPLDRLWSLLRTSAGTAASDLNPVTLARHVYEAGVSEPIPGAQAVDPLMAALTALRNLLGARDAHGQPLTTAPSPVQTFDPLRAAVNVGRGLLGAHVDQGRQAIAAAQEGQLSEALGHTGAALLPVVGPAAAAIGEQIGTGDPEEMAEGVGHLSAMVAGPPATRALARGATRLSRAVSTRANTAAQQDIREAFNPTRHRTKVKTERIVPEVQRRGLRGTLEELQEMATTQRESFGRQIDQELQQARHGIVDIRPVRTTLQAMKRQTYRVVNGKLAVHNPRKLAQIDDVERLLDTYGDRMTVDQAVAVRRAWDEVIEKAGGFDEKSAAAPFGVSLADWSEANVKLPLRGAMRQQLARAVPKVNALNREFSFWSDLEDVVKATNSRRVGQRGRGLLSKVSGAGARAAGATAGASAGPAGAVSGALIAGELAERLTGLFNSPRWKLTASHLKTELADALASGDASRIGRAVARIQRVQAGSAAMREPVAFPRAAEDREAPPPATAQR